MRNSFRSAKTNFQAGNLKRVVVISSTMIYEGNLASSYEDDAIKIPPGIYAFQKLACEYYAKAAYIQYGVPYTNIRISNCVGVGEDKAIHTDIKSSHVIPDLINKILVEKQDPLVIRGNGNQTRCFTNGKDIARAVRLAMNNPKAINESFNIANNAQIKIIDLAKMIWDKLVQGKEFKPSFVPTYIEDPQHNDISTHKAWRILGFSADISLEDSVDEAIEYIRCQN
jgi:nucleoside-diphosphate-sugar epimerase